MLQQTEHLIRVSFPPSLLQPSIAYLGGRELAVSLPDGSDQTWAASSISHPEVTLTGEDFLFELGQGEEHIPTGELQGDVPTGPLEADVPTFISSAEEADCEPR